MYLPIPALLFSLALFLAPQGQKNPQPEPSIRDRIEEHQHPVPYLYRGAAPVAAHTGRYNIDPSPNILTGSMIIKDGWSPFSPPLPVSEADLVAWAVVAEAQSYLSKDASVIYTSFKLEVTDVIRHRSFITAAAIHNLSAERVGGALEMPDGKTLSYIVDGQGQPRVGDEYIFFLRLIDTDDPIAAPIFEILTAYEIFEGRIVPIDKFANFPHAGEDVASFIEKVERAK